MEILAPKPVRLLIFINDTIAKTWPGEAPDASLESFAQAATEVGKAMADLCERHYELLMDESVELGTDHLPSFVYTFLWPDQAKSFLLLWRDILFELQKGRLLLANEQVELSTYKNLVHKSQATLSEAAISLNEFADQQIRQIEQDRKAPRRQTASWQLQQNPWPIYRDQLGAIAGQCQYLHQQEQMLKAADARGTDIKALVYNVLESCTSEIEETKKMAQSAKELVKEVNKTNSEFSANKLANKLETLEEDTKLLHHFDLFNIALDAHIRQLPEKSEVPVAVEEGVLQYKEINFRRSIKLWLDSEIMPVLYELWELTEHTSNSLKMTLVNIRNRLLLISKEQSENSELQFNEVEINQPLHIFLNKTNETIEQTRKLKLLIRKRLSEHFHLTQIYKLDADFLPLPLQSTLNQLKFNQNRLVTDARQWLARQSRSLQQFRNNVEHSEAMSSSEKVVQFIKSRKAAEDTNSYTSIFATKGYIGESFWVGRERESMHIKELIDSWQEGFRGAVMITGQRLTGKSLFGDMVADQHFSANTLRLQPHNTIDFQGRKMQLGCDLEEALNFVVKYALNERPLVWIDDFELWQDAEVPLSQNWRKLQRFIDDYSNRLFFMVAMSNWVKAHLSKMQQIGRVFQSEINLDRMPVEAIREAILIRHGATHKLLTDEVGKEVTSQQFQQMIKKTYRLAEGNIGEALNLWSASIRRRNEDQVTFSPQLNYHLPDFLNPDSALVLSAIMMERRTNEYRLRKLFGPAFSDKYRSIVQRLISVGLLRRQMDGWLEVTEVAANELGRSLEARNHIRFYHHANEKSR